MKTKNAAAVLSKPFAYVGMSRVELQNRIDAAIVDISTGLLSGLELENIKRESVRMATTLLRRG